MMIDKQQIIKLLEKELRDNHFNKYDDEFTHGFKQGLEKALKIITKLDEVKTTPYTKCTLGCHMAFGEVFHHPNCPERENNDE